MRSVLLVAVVLLSGAVAAAAQERCIVSDPTGTQLNVRTSPDGPHAGNTTLPNGLPVFILSTSSDGRWAQVAYSADSRPIGWVYRPYLRC
jgi:uncharacterized protein YraI